MPFSTDHALWMTCQIMPSTARDALGMSTAPMLLADGISALGHTVGVVVRYGPEEQMPRIAARRVVTVVKGADAIRDGAVGKSPSYAVRNLASKPPVSITTQGCPPQPASVGTARAIHV
jgi:hypothetical protein